MEVSVDQADLGVDTLVDPEDTVVTQVVDTLVDPEADSEEVTGVDSEVVMGVVSEVVMEVGSDLTVGSEAAVSVVQGAVPVEIID